MHHFGDAGVGVDGPAEFKRGAFQQMGHLQFRQQFGDLGTTHVAAQNLAVVGVDDQFDHAVVFAHRYGLTAGLDVEAANLDVVALFDGLGLGEPEGGNLGMAVGGAGHEGVVQRLGFFAGDGFHGGDALSGRDVRQGQFAGDVADGVDARHVGGHLVVDNDVSPIGRHANGFEPEVFGVGQHADGH